MELDVHTRDQGSCRILGLQGEIDVSVAPDVAELVTTEVAAGRIHLVIDLSEVTFLDSSGLGALVAALKHAQQAGGQLILASASERVQRVLSLTGLTESFGLTATVDEACQRLAGTLT